MFRIRNLYDNKNIETIDQKGPFRVIEYIRISPSIPAQRLRAISLLR